MLNRHFYLNLIEQEFAVHQACALLGPRQVGKTTLAKQIAQQSDESVHYFDLENPDDLLALQNPLRTLEPLKGLIIIDEVQLRPDLFSTLRYLIDNSENRFLILGSASTTLLKQTAESLAGRIGYIEVSPFTLSEPVDQTLLLERGGFPKSYLAKTYELSYRWRKGYIRTYLERDIPALGLNIDPLLMFKFWQMLAHVHGNLLNMNEIATALSISAPTVRRYLDILHGTFMVRLLAPWHENITKRQIKTSKLYFRDSGIINALYMINEQQTIWQNPRIGSIWEGFAIESIARAFQLPSTECFFWRSQNGAELDLLLFLYGKRIGFEFKYGDTPKMTKSMHIAMNDLKLAHLFIIYPGKRRLQITEQATITGLDDFIKHRDELIT